MLKSRGKFHELIDLYRHGYKAASDYELYLELPSLFSCQKPLGELCNADELQFQIVHQISELWLKLIAYTLVDIDACLHQLKTAKSLTLFRRIHLAERMLVHQVELLETMSPKDYQVIRTHLGNGSGQESPGFKLIPKIAKEIWRTYKVKYLNAKSLTIEQIYNSEFTHDDVYAVAEALFEFDAWFQEFRRRHFVLIQRTIGAGSKSLKGRSVDILLKGTEFRFFPELWDIRVEMTSTWGAQYGEVRAPLSKEKA